MVTSALSSFQGLFLDRGSRLCSVTSKQRRDVCNHNKVGFASCQAFGNSKLLSTGEIKVFQKGFTARSVGIARCEVNSEKGNSLDIWLGRVAMVGFVGVVAVEVATGKGVLESVGLVAPLPTVALGLAAVLGLVTAFGVFRSANDS